MSLRFTEVWGGQGGKKELMVWFSINCTKYKNTTVKTEGL